MDINEEVLLSYACEKDELSYTTMLNYFVPKKCAKSTWLKYKRSLEADGKLKKKISSSTGRPVYYVPDAIRKKMEAKNILDEIVESAKAEELEKLVAVLQKEVEQLRYRDLLYAFMESYGQWSMFSKWVKISATDPHPAILGDRPLEEMMAFWEKVEAYGTEFEETLLDAWKKGWISEIERYRCTKSYHHYVESFSKLKKSVAEGKINWVVEEPSRKEARCIYCNELGPYYSVYCPKCGKVRKEWAHLVER